MAEDKGIKALEKFYKELTEDNPQCATLLTRAAVEAYVVNTEPDGKPKSEDAGKNIYDAMFNCLKRFYIPKGDSEYSERGVQLVEDMTRENLGINPAMLEDLIRKGIHFIAFYDGLVKASISNVSKRLDQLSEGTLTPECMTESAKRYLVERAKKLEIQGLENATETAINSIEDFRYIAKKLAENKRRG